MRLFLVRVCAVALMPLLAIAYFLAHLPEWIGNFLDAVGVEADNMASGLWAKVRK